MTDYFDIPRDVRDTLERQDERNGNGEAACPVEILEFAPGVPANRDAVIYDPIAAAVDDFLAEHE